ncbi:MAG: hypothetical protein ACRBF0_16140 [Calditrichia bacterium]
MLDHLFNLTAYTPLELTLFVGGCYMWVIVYGIYVHQLVKHKFAEMPLFAAASNIGWEFVYGYTAPFTDMGAACLWGYRLWFIVDVFIFYGVLKFGMEQVKTIKLKEHFRPVMILTALFWAVAYFAFKSSGHDTIIGANSAYIAQAIISFLYPLWIMNSKRPMLFSRTVAWLRMFGSGLITMFMFIHYESNYYIQVVGTTCVLLDILSIYLVYQRRSEAAPVAVAEAVV